MKTKYTFILSFLIILSLASFTSYAKTIWTGNGTDNNWNNQDNWSNGVPTSSDDVYIGFTTNQPYIYGGIQPAECRDLNIASDATLTQEGGTLYVYRNWSNSGTFNG